MGRWSDDILREELILYVRAWARHRVYFGRSCTWRMLERCVGIFSTSCVSTGPQSLSTLLQAKHHIQPEFHLSCALLDESMTYRFPHRHPDPVKRGILNQRFLNAEPVQEHLILLEQHGVSCIQMVFPIDHVYGTEGVSGSVFLAMLARFLDGLPSHHRYAVELHNREYLLPAYFDMLGKRNIAHVLNTCPTMPALLEQIQLPRALTTDMVIVRTPVHSNPDTVLGIRETVRRCIDERKPLYMYIDDEPGSGSALTSLARLMEMMNSDLAKLSPIKKKAA